jgi:hypothetical protein
MHLGITCVPFNPFHSSINKVMYLPHGSYVSVKQVFCRHATVSISRWIHDEDYVPLTIEQAWYIVAGPQAFFHINDRFDRFWIWNETPCEPHIFQRALLRILEDSHTKILLPIGENYLLRNNIRNRNFRLQLVCGIDADSYPRSIQFNFSSDTVQQYDAILESCQFPAGVNTCIVAYL